MDKFNNMINVSKLNGLIKKQEEKENKKKNVCLILTVIAAVVGVALLAYGLYKYLKPDYLDEFDDNEFDDEFEDDFLDDDDELE